MIWSGSARFVFKSPPSHEDDSTTLGQVHSQPYFIAAWIKGGDRSTLSCTLKCARCCSPQSYIEEPLNNLFRVFIPYLPFQLQGREQYRYWRHRHCCWPHPWLQHNSNRHKYPYNKEIDTQSPRELCISVSLASFPSQLSELPAFYPTSFKKVSSE